MNANTTHSVNKTHRLVIVGLMLLMTIGIASANTAHASHGHYNDGSALSFSISYGYYPEAYVYYDSYRPVHRYRHVDSHRHYVAHPGRHSGRGYKHGHKRGHKHHRKSHRGHHH